MWDQVSKGWDRGSEGWDLGPQPWDQESQTMGSGSAVSYRYQDQVVPHLRDQGQKLVTVLESRNRNLRTKMGSAMKNSLPPCYYLLLARDLTRRILPSVVLVRPRAIFSQYGPRAQLIRSK